MSRTWLKSPAILFLGLIATMATIWVTIIWPAAHWGQSRRPEQSAKPRAPATQPTTTVMVPCRYAGSAVSTSDTPNASVIPITNDGLKTIKLIVPDEDIPGYYREAPVAQL